MHSDDYFTDKEFLAVLKDYEDCRRRGVPCIISSDDYTDIAEYYHIHDGDIRHAEEVIDTAIELYPGAAAPLAFKARLCLLREESTEKAMNWLEQTEDKTDWEYYYTRAEIMLVENQPEQADEYLRQCFESLDDEDDEEDFVFDVANLFCDYNYMEEAAKWIEKANDKSDPDYKDVKARILISHGKYEEGERMLNKLIDGNPFAAPYWNSLATSQFQRNAFNESISSSEYSLALNPNDDEALLNKANALYQLGSYEEAAKYYERYIKVRSDDEAGELFLAICLLCCNRITEAETHLRKAEKLADKTKRNQFEIYQELAFTLSRLGKVDEALDYVDKADNQEDRHDEMTVLKGHIMLEHGHMEEAQAFFEEAMAESQSSPHILLKIAVSIYDNGFLILAQKMFRVLLENVDTKTWNEGYGYMAACAKERGNNEEWLKYLKMAVEKNPMEAQSVLCDYFPEGMEAAEYYDYACENML